MSLSELRKEIDRIDAEVLALLSRRAELAIEIGHRKARDHASLWAPEREQHVFGRLEKLNPGPLPQGAVRAIYREIISASLALEKPLTIAFWGPLGTFSHQAAAGRFGSSARMSPVESIPDVFLEVERGQADYGVVPVENSTAGVVPETLDQFRQTNLRVCAEHFVPIAHNLLTRATDLGQVRRLYSGPQPFAQCRIWLRNHLPGVEQIEVGSTARAAEMAAADGPEAAAVGPALAGETYGLPTLREHIEDHPHNFTRFLVLGYNEPDRTGRDKTSLMFSVKHKAGALFRAMAAFEKYDVNMTMIESRPTKQLPWEYQFYLDIQGHRKDEPVKKALAALSEQSLFVTILGSYPEAEP